MNIYRSFVRLKKQMVLSDTSMLTRLEYLRTTWGVLTPMTWEKRPFGGRKLEDAKEGPFRQPIAE
jgi:hypothetical protein